MEKHKNKIKTSASVLWRALLSFLVVFVIGILGTYHYRSVRKSSVRPETATCSGNMIEDISDSQRFPSHRVLTSNGIVFDVTRTIEAANSEDVRNDLTARMRSEGWKKIRVPDKTNPLKKLNVSDSATIYDFYISPDNKIAGYAIDKRGGKSAITRVSFSLNEIRRHIRETQYGFGRGSSSLRVPEVYKEIMVTPPVMSFTGSSADSTGIYVCEFRGQTIADVADTLYSNIRNNNWQKEIVGDIVACRKILDKQNIISARKADILCNIMLSQDENGEGVIASYRFSKLWHVETRR